MGGTLLNLLLVGCLLLSPSSNLHPAFKASQPPRSGEEQRGDTADQGRPPTRPPSAGHGPPRPSVDLLCFGAHGAWLAGVSCPVRFGLHVELGPRPPTGRASEFMAIHHAQGQRPHRAQAARAQAARAQACLDYSSGSRWLSPPSPVGPFLVKASAHTPERLRSGGRGSAVHAPRPRTHLDPVHWEKDRRRHTRVVFPNLRPQFQKAPEFISKWRQTWH